MWHCAGFERLLGVSGPKGAGQGRGHAVQVSRGRVDRREAVAGAAGGAAAGAEHHRPLQVLQGVPRPETS